MSIKFLIAPAALTLSLVLTGCSADSAEPVGQSASVISFPETEIGDQAKWIVAQLNSSDGVVVEELEMRLSEKVTDQMSAAELAAVLENDVAAKGPFVLTGFDDQGARALATVQNESGKSFILTIALDPEGGKLDGVYFKAK